MIPINNATAGSFRLLRQFAAALAVLAVIAGVFWPATHGGFIFDDYPIFVENPSIQVTGWHWEEWQKVLHWSLVNIQRPLAMLTYALNYAVGGSTLSFKLTNLCIHLINSALVFALVTRLLKAAWAPNRGNDRRSLVDYGAAGIALAWAVHPLQVSTVMYVVQRMEMLGFTFTLLALLIYWHARACQQSGRRAWPWLLTFFGLVGVGYFAKETAILVPGYALAIELTLLHFRAASTDVSRAWKAFYIAGVLAAASFLLFHLIPHVATPANYAGRDFTAGQRELTQLRALPLYIYWSVFPLPSHLQFYYDNYPVSTDLFHPIETLFGAIFLAGLIAFAIAVRLRRPLIALGIGWFFVAHLITSSPIPLELVFEHRNYPALLGVLFVIADVLRMLFSRFSMRTAALLASVLILNLCFLTFIRSSIWSSPFQLSMALAEANPGSVRAALDLARRYMAMSHGDPDAPFYSMGIRELERAAKLPADSPLPEEALLLIAADNPQVPAQPWWDSFILKLKTRPLIPDTFLALHNLMTQRVNGKTGIDAQQLSNAYAVAVARAPHRQLLHAEYAELAGKSLRAPRLAIPQWQETLKLEKDLPTYARQLAAYLAADQRDQEADAVITYATQLQPSLGNDPQLLAIRAQIQSHQGTDIRPTP